MENNCLEVNLENISHNLKQIKKIAGSNKTIIPVIKADAYRLGAIALKDVLEENNINIVAVALIKEAIELRKNGFKMEILVLNEILKEESEIAIDYNLTVGVSTMEVVKELDKFAKLKNEKSKVHIKIDTGMGRVGIQPDEVVTFVKEISKLNNVEINGVYTHLSSADGLDDESVKYTKKQINIFAQQVEYINNMNIYPKYIHACASSGIVRYNDERFNSVRPGILLYGYMPSDEAKKLDIKPTTILKSKVVFIKTVSEGTSIGYSRKYTTNKETKIATVGMGYADGLRRNLSNNQDVLINGKRAPILGNICMDNFMVDITNIDNVKIGNDVIIWDNKEIKLEDIAEKCNTITYEILCGISKRVKRQYK